MFDTMTDTVIVMLFLGLFAFAYETYVLALYIRSIGGYGQIRFCPTCRSDIELDGTCGCK
jgi:hypothetical protein